MVDTEKGEGSKCDWRPDLWSQMLKLRIDPVCLLTQVRGVCVIYTAACSRRRRVFGGILGLSLESFIGGKKKMKIETIKDALWK